jgi:hypothetical protein
VIAFKKKPEDSECSVRRTFSFIAHTAKRVGRILRRRTERKIEDVLGGRRGKGTKDPTGMLE